MNEQSNKLKNRIVDNHFLNVDFSLTIAHRDFNSRLLSLHTPLEGTVSQIFYLGLGFYFMSKNGKHFLNYIKQKLGPK